MKVLITWIGPWLDKGEAAMLISTANALRDRIPNVSIAVSTSSFMPQEIDEIEYGEYDIDVLPGIFLDFHSAVSKFRFLGNRMLKAVVILPVFFGVMIFNTLWLGLYRILGLNIAFLLGDRRGIIKEYKDANWVIFCGGEYIINVRIGLIIALYEIIFSKLLSKPVMMYAQSFGPFNQKYARFWIKAILNRVDLITTREEISKEYLETLGVVAPIYKTADAAFMLPSISRDEAISLLKNEARISKNELMVGMTTIYKDFPSQNDQPNQTLEEYFSSMAEAADYIIKKLNAYVIFFPHNKTIDAARNDELASREIYKRIKNKSRAVILTNDFKPEQLKGMYGCMSLFIGTRYHSCIFAMSMGVPTIAIGYRHKAQGIMKMLEMENYVCDINTITSYELITTINKIWDEKDKVRKKLEKNIKVMQDECMNNIELAIRYLVVDAKSRTPP